MNILSQVGTPPWRLKLVGAVILLVLAATTSISGVVVAAPLSPTGTNMTPSPVSNGWLAQMRQAGLQGNRSQIRLMIKILQSPPGAESLSVVYTTRLSLLRPLAQLGATEALPVLSSIIQRDPNKPFPGLTYTDAWENEQVIARARAVKARIITQSSTQGIADDKSRASAEVKRFFLELGQTPTSLNAAVASYKAENQRHLAATRLVSDERDNAVPVELFAVRELADMAYHDRYRGFASLPDVARVDFNQDDGSALKVRLAPLPREQRIATLVGELSAEQIGDIHALYRAQLLADEGPTALPLMKAKQQDFIVHRRQYMEKLHGHFGGLSILDRAQEHIPAADKAAQALQTDSVTVEADMLNSACPRQFVPGY